MNKLHIKILDNIPSSWIIWIIFYSYCICSAILFQQIALPYLAPALHAGNGLLNLDSLFFHEKAILIAEALGQEGWAKWLTVLERSPSGNVTVVALVYALFGFNPTLIIPINAALHASSGLLLIKIGQALFPQNNYKWGCFLPVFYLLFSLLV